MPGVHLTGDRIIQETTLQYLKAMQDEWGVPGVSLAIVRMNEDKQWDKQTIGMGRKDVEGDQVTEQASCIILCSTPLTLSVSSGQNCRKLIMTSFCSARRYSALPPIRSSSLPSLLVFSCLSPT